MDVVVTRERGHNEVLKAWLPEGASVSEVPLTQTHFLDNDAVLTALRSSTNYGQYRVLVVTSARSALYVALARAALGTGGTVHTVGTATARALENEDVDVDVVGTAGSLGPRPGDRRGTGPAPGRRRNARRTRRGTRPDAASR